jgi:asparagine synthase (glutamine-hydrolysing)
MCGFAGILSLKKNVQSEHLQLMQQSIMHRGPDSNGIWMSEDHIVGFCHNRLSIIDITSAGAQPMKSQNGRYIISYNGEIYNHLVLRAELLKECNSIHFISSSDTETLLACFENWGIEKTLSKTVGMFAFSVWDIQENTLYLGRDRMGEKPLYFGWIDDILFFGSELKALKAHPNFKVSIDHSALGMFFRYSYIPAPHSIYSNIKKLMPGTIFKVDSSGKSETIVYWDLNKIVSNGLQQQYTGNDKEAIQELDLRLNQTILSQQISDVPIGAFLSGGIDSTLISSIMQANSNSSINTFTIGFKDDKYNEANYALEIAKHLKTNHHELYLSANDIITEVPKMGSIYDEPFADSSQLPTYFVCALAKKTVTVALSGDAGDEIFGGYNRYMQAAKLSRYSPITKKALVKILNQFSPSQIDFIYDLLKPLLPNSIKSSNPGNHYSKIVKLLGQDTNWDIYQCLVSICSSPNSLMKNNFVNDGINNFTKYIFENSMQLETKMMLSDSLTYLSDDILCKVDRASMSVSLESRVPFLDHRIVEFSSTLPLNMKIRDGKGKWILRKLLEKYVPNQLLDRPKMGFGLPLDIWLRGPLKDYAYSMLREKKLNEDEFLDQQKITKIWNEHLSGLKNHQHVLWNIIMYQSWKEKWH